MVALQVFLFAVFEARLPQFSSAQTLMNHLTFFLLINLNVLLLVVFVFLVGRNLVKLLLERRQRILGSHLRWRLVIAFVGLSLFPAVLLFIASTNFMDNSIEKWFDVKVEQSLEGSHEVVQASTGRRPAQCCPAPGDRCGDRHPRLMANTPSSNAGSRRGARTAIQGGSGLSPRRGVVKSRFQGGDERHHRRPRCRVVRRSRRQGTRASSRWGDGDVRGTSPIVDHDKVVGAVVVDQYVSMSLSQRAEDIERSFREYRELKLLKQPIKNTYLLTLTLITLVVVFAATWYGLSLAKGITVPIQQLAEGTREVAHGNWEVHIAGEGEDEIGTLVSAFNR